MVEDTGRVHVGTETFSRSTMEVGKLHIPISSNPMLDGPYYTNRSARRAYQRSIRKFGAGVTRSYRKGRKSNDSD